MAVELFTDGLEPSDESAVIWRFMEMWKFRDLIQTGEPHFTRADRFSDESEGLPPEDYLHVLGLHPLDIQGLNHCIASIAQHREGFFINCWQLFEEETAAMWKVYGNGGVAICSRYNLLKCVLSECDGRPHLGLVRYGSAHLTGWNVQRFISTKRLK